MNAHNVSEYRANRNRAKKAADIGNMAACREFSRRASALDWVTPKDWNPAACFANGPMFTGQEFSDLARWAKKSDAMDAARSLGWPVDSVSKVCSRFCISWSLVDGRFGYMSKSMLQRLSS